MPVNLGMSRELRKMFTENPNISVGAAVTNLRSVLGPVTSRRNMCSAYYKMRPGNYSSYRSTKAHPIRANSPSIITTIRQIKKFASNLGGMTRLKDLVNVLA